jgi:hypothetical protein
VCLPSHSSPCFVLSLFIFSYPYLLSFSLSSLCIVYLFLPLILFLPLHTLSLSFCFLIFPSYKHPVFSHFLLYFVPFSLLTFFALLIPSCFSFLFSSDFYFVFPFTQAAVFVLDLWWTKWHWDRFLSEHFGFPLSVSFHQSSIFIHLSPTTM